MHKNQLENPNHVDILNGMWPLFTILVNISGTPPVARQVVNPLLIQDAVNMLNNFLPSSQKIFWIALGEAWTIPRFELYLYF